ncbi:MAG: DNA-binding protein WhiA [Clostridiales bacterium]|nr:DNA-binding protein WhiA [Clostridiales bacterium]
MSFTTDLKKEIISRFAGEERTEGEKKSAFSAFVRTSGALGMQENVPTFFLVSETEYVAEFFMHLFAECFNAELSVTHATMDRMSGRDKLVLLCPANMGETVLSQLRLLKRGGEDFREGICKLLVKGEDRKIAYIKGAYLGGGSCTLPTDGGTGYHLEIVFNEKKTAQDFCLILDEFDLFAKWIERKDTYVVYMKSKEAISDFLATIGAHNSLKKLVAVSEKREEANNDNRTRNCMAGNADKSAIASVKQVVAIRKIEEKTKYKDLNEELVALAKLRLQYPEKTLQELADMLGVSKSCLNHRMRRLIEIAEEI